MYRDEDHVTVLVDQFDSFLGPVSHMSLDQSAVLPYTMVDMYHIITYPECIQVVDGHLLGPFHLTAYAQLVITLEYLMIGIIAVLRILVDISFMERNGKEMGLHVPEYFPEPSRLAFVRRQDGDFVSIYLPVDYVI